MLNILYSAILGGMIGALLGLIPFFLGRAQGKPNLALLALLCCTVGGAIIVWLAIAVAIGFVIAVLASGRDCAPLFPSKTPTMAVPLNGPIDYEFNYTQHLGIACLSGPLKGQVYSVGSGGLMIGRDYDCAVQYNANTPGIPPPLLLAVVPGPGHAGRPGLQLRLLPGRRPEAAPQLPRPHPGGRQILPGHPAEYLPAH